MTQQEIQLLIKARLDAEGAFTQLSSHLKQVTGESDGAGDGIDRFTKKVDQSQASSVAAGVVIGNLAIMVGQKLKQGFTDSLDEASRLDSSLIGLTTIARSFGQDAGKATDAARSLADDGLMTVADAAAGLKNLLAAGFSLPEAITLMERFKDTAAFGRQGALSFGESIVGATEGIKNGNSILVDNVGITKNLSNILVEAGFSQQDLNRATSDGSVRQALYKGLIKESAPFIGDHAKLLDTASGKQSQFNAQTIIAEQNIGKKLQPTYVAFLNTMMPLVKVLGDNADVVVPLGIATAALVGPIIAAVAAARLGAPSFLSMGSAAASTLSIFSGVRTFTDARAGIQLVGEAAGITTGQLGLLGTAGAVAGVAFAGWQIGRLIGELTGLDGALQNLLLRLRGVNEAQFSQQVQQDEIARAVAKGAAATISFADAVKYNADMEAIRQAQWNKSAPIQMAAIDAEVRLGKITQQAADLLKAQIVLEDKMAQQRASRVSVSDAVAKAEANVRAELAAAGVTMKDAIGLLAKNEIGFRAWAKENELTAPTIAAVEQALKRQTDAQKKAADESEKHQQQIKKTRDELEQLGVLTLPIVHDKLKEMAAREAQAMADGASLDRVLSAMLPTLEDLSKKAHASGVGVDEVDAALTRARLSAAKSIPVFAEVKNVSIDQLLAGFPKVSVTIDEHQLALDRASSGYKFFGITSRDELRKTAEASRQHYENIAAAVGKSAPEAVAAYKKMVDDQKAASGTLPPHWQTEIVPKVKQSIETMKTAVDGSFAQMLLGAKSFKDGFVDIWHSIASGAEQALASVVQYFMDGVLKKILGALSGQKGAISGGLSQSLAGAIGVGGAGAAVSAGSAGGSIFADGSGTGAMTGFGASKSDAIGGAMAVAGAMGLIASLQSGSKLGATVSGATTGAGIGTMIMPGVGTALGAGIGAAGGFVASLLGGGGNDGRKAIDAWVKEQFGGDYNKLHQQLNGVENGEQLWVQATQQSRNKDQAAAAIKAVNDALATQQQKIADTDAALKQYGLTWQDMDQSEHGKALVKTTDDLLAQQKLLTDAHVSEDTAIKKMAPAWNDLLAAALKTGDGIPPAMQPTLDKLAKMGLLTDENKAKLLGLSDEGTVDFEAMQQVADKYGISIDALGPKFQQTRLGALAKQYADDFNMLKDSGADVNGLLDGMKDEVSDLVQQSIKYGTDIPDNMRPVIESLAQQGKLVDANGDKITDTSKLKFSKPLEDQVGELSKAIDKLGQIFAGNFPDMVRSGIDTAVRIVGDAEFPDVKVGVRYEDRGGAGGDVKLPGAANGIFANSPTFRVFAENEPELGGPVSFMSKALAGAIDQVGLPAAPASSGAPKIFIVVDPSGNNTRQITEAEFNQIQDRLASGRLRVPARAVTQRV